MENTTMDITLTLISILGFAYVFLRLLVTVVPLQIKEARVVNGLAKLRYRLLILGITNMGVALIGMLILIFSLIVPSYPNFLESMVLLMVALMVVNAENKHGIYHEQYTAEHKELSRKIQKQMDRKESHK